MGEKWEIRRLGRWVTALGVGAGEQEEKGPTSKQKH